MARVLLKPGSVDLWKLDHLVYGRELPCQKSHRFLYYLASPSTCYVVPQDVDAKGGSVLLKVVGPDADDKKPLSILFRLSKAHLKSFSEDEIKQLEEALNHHMTSTFATCKALNLRWMK